VGAAAAAGASLALPAVGKKAVAGSVSDLKIGISTLGFPDHTNQSLAEELSQAGFSIIQLFLSQSDSSYWKYNGRSDVSDMTAARSAAIAETYRSAGLSIHSIGVYTNLIHPDESEVEANLAYFDEMMRIGGDMGVHTFITEAGHFHDEGPAPTVPLHFQDTVWTRMVATFKRLAEMAEKRESTILAEPYFQSFFASAKRTRVFLEEVDSPRIRALLDPANLLEINDLEEMFTQMGPWIDCLHAKDRKLHAHAGVAAGKGDLDYLRFVQLAAEKTPNAPLVLEYVGQDTYKEALQHLQNAIKKAL
jgi:sugar phosphate isomerase/epimerase